MIKIIEDERIEELRIEKMILTTEMIDLIEMTTITAETMDMLETIERR